MKLPQLQPSSPRNNLSVEARLRIEKIISESEVTIHEARIACEEQNIEAFSEGWWLHINRAKLERAKRVFSVLSAEYSVLHVSNTQYWNWMEDELDGATSSMELSASQTDLLRSMFFFREAPAPETKAAIELQLTHVPLSPFEQLGGDLYREALGSSPRHRVTQEALVEIGKKLDHAKFVPAKDYLEKNHAKAFADYNQKRGIRAITTWEELAASSGTAIVAGQTVRVQHFMRRILQHVAQKQRRNRTV